MPPGLGGVLDGAPAGRADGSCCGRRRSLGSTPRLARCRRRTPCQRLGGRHSGSHHGRVGPTPPRRCHSRAPLRGPSGSVVASQKSAGLPSGSVDAVIWDLDDTLVVERPAAEAAMAAACRYAATLLDVDPTRLGQDVFEEAKSHWWNLPTFSFARRVGIARYAMANNCFDMGLGFGFHSMCMALGQAKRIAAGYGLSLEGGKQPRNDNFKNQSRHQPSQSTKSPTTTAAPCRLWRPRPSENRRQGYRRAH